MIVDWVEAIDFELTFLFYVVSFHKHLLDVQMFFWILFHLGLHAMEIIQREMLFLLP